MPKIKAIAPTIIRLEKNPKLELNIKKGQEVAVHEILPSQGQIVVGELAGNLGEFKTGDLVTLYRPHWNHDQWSKNVFAGTQLRVPYYAQCDTRPDGWRYCFSHACAMAAAYILKDFEVRSRVLGYDQPEQRYIDRVLEHGDTTDPLAQLAALKDLGISAYFTQTLSPKDLYRLIVEYKIAVPIGVSYSSSGHWVTVVGYSDRGWLVHDPYGIRDGSRNSYVCNSTDSGAEGAFDIYSQECMDAIFWDQRSDTEKECGWAIVISMVGSRVVAPPHL